MLIYSIVVVACLILSVPSLSLLSKQVLICVQAVDSNTLSSNASARTTKRCSTLSGLSFCMYLKLLRRLAHLVEIDDSCSVQTTPETTLEKESHNECGICMARPQDTVLPCLHGVCSSCEKQWVETHKDCPFCRQQYKNAHRRKRDQWQVSLSLLCYFVCWNESCTNKSYYMYSYTSWRHGIRTMWRRTW